MAYRILISIDQSRQNVESPLPTLVDIHANRIPELRSLLPFIYQSWIVTLQQHGRLETSQCKVPFLRIGILKLQHTGRDATGRRCLS